MLFGEANHRCKCPAGFSGTTCGQKTFQKPGAKVNVTGKVDTSGHLPKKPAVGGADLTIFGIAKTIFGGGVLAMVILGGLIFFKNRNSRKAAQTEQVRLSTCSLDL